MPNNFLPKLEKNRFYMSKRSLVSAHFFVFEIFKNYVANYDDFGVILKLAIVAIQRHQDHGISLYGC